MLRNSSNAKKALLIIGFPVWTFFSFMLAQAIIVVTLELARTVGVDFSAISEVIFNTVANGAIYTLSILIVIGVPWLVKKSRTTPEELGVQRYPNWKDFAWAPAGLVVYFILTAIITTLAMSFLPFIDYNQAQETGYSGISQQYEYILAFLMLVIVAPIAEEVLFRGYLFGKLRKYAPIWLSILITSVLFAMVHFAWNVGLDVFALSIVLCVLRVVSGSLWPSIMLHMMKNGIAFYFLFINPLFLSTLGG